MMSWKDYVAVIVIIVCAVLLFVLVACAPTPPVPTTIGPPSTAGPHPYTP